MVISNSHDFHDPCAHSHLYTYRHDNHENQDNHNHLDSQSGDHRVGEKEAGFDSERARTGRAARRG